MAADAFRMTRMSDFSPRRVVSLQPSATVTLARLGLLDRVVACTRYCKDVCPELAFRRSRSLPIPGLRKRPRLQRRVPTW